MAFISVTRLRVRRLAYLPGFILFALRSARQAKRAAGNLGVGLLREANRTFWTRTAWRDESSMKAFMLAMPHRKAMEKIADWGDETAVVHLTPENAGLTDRHEAHRRLRVDGRRSKVKHPSADHEAYQIAPPKVGIGKG